LARTPQSFEKRQRERRKQQKRDDKFERRMVRADEKKLRKENGGVLPGELPLGPDGGRSDIEDMDQFERAREEDLLD